MMPLKIYSIVSIFENLDVKSTKSLCFSKLEFMTSERASRKSLPPNSLRNVDNILHTTSRHSPTLSLKFPVVVIHSFRLPSPPTHAPSTPSTPTLAARTPHPRSFRIAPHTTKPRRMSPLHA